MSLLQQRESLPVWPWGLWCPAFIKSLYGFYMLLPDRRALEINNKVEDIYVHQEQEEHGKRWCKDTTLLIINRTNCSHQSWLFLPERGNTCMIIVKDSPNCVWCVTDTAWLKLHKNRWIYFFTPAAHAVSSWMAVRNQRETGDKDEWKRKKTSWLLFCKDQWGFRPTASMKERQQGDQVKARNEGIVWFE